MFDSELESARSWARRCAAALRDLPPGPSGAATAFAYAVRSWTSDRERAALYAEARARPHSEALVGAAHARIFRPLFEGIERELDLAPGSAGPMHAAFELQALLHLSQWRPALEEAVLGELADRLATAWLARETGRPAPCPAFARAAQLTARPPEQLAPMAQRLAQAGVAVVGRLGLEGLTHRAVASELGLTAGAVAHYFRTSEELLAGVLRGQVEALLREAGGAPDGEPSPAEFARGYVARAGADQPPTPIVGRNDLFLATLRRPDFASLGATIRFTHGATTARMLPTRLSTRPDAPVLAALASLMLGGLWRACAGAADPRAERVELAERIVTQLFAA